LHEWMEGWKGVVDHGLVAFATISDEDEAKRVFEAMDDNQGGIVLLDEWCNYIKDKEVEAGTVAGNLLAADEATPPPPPAGKEGAKPGAKAKIPAEELEPAEAGDLYDFTAPFEPMAERSELGKALRKRGFKLADPNGNGLCSLAELETFVLQTLMQAYPKDPKKKDHRGDPLERGRDLFDAYRPSYIRAFNDAKDYKADSGKVLAGTKKCTADDFVSKGEFRLFCAYLGIYARMVRSVLRVICS